MLKFMVYTRLLAILKPNVSKFLTKTIQDDVATLLNVYSTEFSTMCGERRGRRVEWKSVL